MKKGLQLYTIRDSYSNGEELKEILKKVKELGFEELEFAGFADLEAEELRDYLKEIGLTPISSHQSLENLSVNLEETVRYHKILGVPYIACAIAPTSTAEEMENLLKILTTAREVVKENGMELLYHNHAHEFVKLPDGRLPIELIRETIRLELDTFWVFHAGTEPCAYIKEHAGDIALIHLKDGDFEGHPLALGEGYNNIKGIAAMASAIGLNQLIIENDNPSPDGLFDIGRSINYLNKLLNNE